MQVRIASVRFLLVFCVLLLGLASGIRFVNGDAQKAVSFVFSDLDNRTIRLADYQGKWVLVSFWAPWCPLCKVQVPSLNRLNQRQDFRVIGIALEYGDGEDAIRKAIDQGGYRFDAQVAGGSRREPNSAFLQVGPVDFFPTSYLYDPTGEIVMFIPGQIRVPRILAFIDSWRAQQGDQRQPVFGAKLDRLAAVLKQRHGARGSKAFDDWKRMLDAAASGTPAQKLARVNAFFNSRIQAGEDQQIWSRPDYWATLGDVLGSGRGDSEDFVIAKYFTLLALNVRPEQLRLVYVKPRAAARSTDPVHMVLAYYDAPGRDPSILDNLVRDVLPAASRTDLQPVYSFNSLGVWEETANAAAAGDPNRLAVWEDTLRRARAEGFE
jgi:predicted transglutaminase-like cysteine proteinase